VNKTEPTYCTNSTRIKSTFLTTSSGNKCTPCKTTQLLPSQQKYASTYCKWVSTGIQRMPCFFF
jgi:hypothetical protein